MLTLTAGIAVAAIGLSGQDPDLDRTAALPWPVRRFAHLALIGLAAGGAVLAVQELGTPTVDLSIILRDAAGLLGLAGLAATVAGGQFGWTLPLLWAAITPVRPGRRLDDEPHRGLDAAATGVSGGHLDGGGTGGLGHGGLHGLGRPPVTPGSRGGSAGSRGTA